MDQAVAAPAPVTPAISQQGSHAEVPPPEVSLLDELPVNETTKQAGASVLRNVGLRIGGSGLTLWTCGVAGKLFVLAVLLIFLGVVYYYRRDLLALARRVLRRFKEAS